MEKSVKVKWLGHSCFKLECGGASLVIDPYDHVEGYPELHAKANEVICSHSHGDHGFVQAVEITPFEGQSPFEITRVDSFHDNEGGAKRGTNIIHVIKAAGLTLVHLGDLGHTLEKHQLELIGRADLVMVPVGGHYTIDAKTAKEVCDSLDPTVIVPMHYRRGDKGFSVIATLDDFTGLYDKSMIKEYGDELTLTKETPKQLAVLTFKD